jgi:hypothetical protein
MFLEALIFPEVMNNNFSEVDFYIGNKMAEIMRRDLFSSSYFQKSAIGKIWINKIFYDFMRIDQVILVFYNFFGLRLYYTLAGERKDLWRVFQSSNDSDF